MRSSNFERDIDNDQDRAFVRALRFAPSPRPEFREALREEFVAQARSDAQRRSAYRRSLFSLPGMTLSFAALGAIAAAIILVVSAGSWFRLPRPDAPFSVADAPRALLGPASSKPSQPSPLSLNAVPKAAVEPIQEAGATEPLGGAYGAMLGASRSQALGFGPWEIGGESNVYVVSRLPFSDEAEAELKRIAAETGGSITVDHVGSKEAETSGAASTAGTASAAGTAVSMTIPGNVLDHVLTRLEVVHPAEISRPVQVTTDTVVVIVRFSLN
ncbi:MAG: hypothetical protein VB144_10835 [Clostridia bacterium]|nr:hypothetical protein [Clostridia bacterium]